MFSKKEFAFISNLRFISRKNAMLSWVAYKNITSGPVGAKITKNVQIIASFLQPLTLVMLNKLSCHIHFQIQPVRLLDPSCWYKFTYLMINSAEQAQQAHSIKMTSYQRRSHHVASTLIRRHFNVVCLLGDQLASEETNWSGSTLFAKAGHIRFSRTRVNPVDNNICVTFVTRIAHVRNMRA